MRSRPPTLTRHLRVTFVILAITLTVIGAAGAAGLLAANRVVDETIDRRGQLWSLNRDLLITMLNAESAALRYAVTGDERDLASYRSARDSFPQVMTTTVGLAGDFQLERFRRQGRLFDQWVEAVGERVVNARQGDPATARQLATSDESRRLIEEFRDTNSGVAANVAIEVVSSADRMDTIVQRAAVVLAVALVVSVVSGQRMHRRLQRDMRLPLQDVRGTLRRIEAGDTGARVEPSGVEEIQGVARALNAMSEENQRLIAQKGRRLDRERQVAHASRQIRSSLDRGAVLSAAAEAVGLTVEVDQVTVRAVGDKGENLGTETWTEGALAEDRESPPFPTLADGAIEQLLFGQTVEIESPGDPHLTPAGQDWLRRQGYARGLIVPVLAGGRMVGVLGVAWKDEQRTLDDEERATVDAVRRELGAALGHARLYESERALVGKLQEVDQTKSDFISSVSHELRTPLSSIAGYVEMLQDGDLGELSSQQDHALDVVERSTRRLQNLIEDLLTLSRIEGGTFAVELGSVDLAEVVRTTLGSFSGRLHQRRQELVTNVDESLPPVHGDPAQLERVVANLVGNAIKFTPEGGRITVRLCATDDQRIELAVEDTGVGIPVEEQQNLFTRFFRSSTAQELAIPGTGMGLVIVQEIVKKHGGTVDMSSAPGSGSTFVVRLPQSSAHLDSRPEDPSG